MSCSMSFPKVELHLHFDGAFRHQTIFELGKAKDTDTIRRFATADELEAALLCEKKADLGHILADFAIFIPAVLGDAAAIERCAYELAEDKAADGLVYFEARHCPQLLANTVAQNPNLAKGAKPYSAAGPVTPEDVVKAVERGLRRGEADFGVQSRQILSGIRGFPDYAEEILRLATELYAPELPGGIAGVDLAGSHETAAETCDPEYRRLFEAAKERGIRRTVHAGESGTADYVLQAVRELHAERLGHGYHVVDSKEIFDEVRSLGVHLEACPTSSLLTGAVAGWEDHPIITYAALGADFSISTDDPLLFGCSLSDELRTAEARLRLPIHQLWQCQLSAAKAAFASEKDRKALVEKILAANPLVDL